MTPDRLLQKKIHFLGVPHLKDVKPTSGLSAATSRTLFSLHFLDLLQSRLLGADIYLCRHLPSVVSSTVHFLPACDSDSISWLKLFSLLFSGISAHKSSTCCYLYPLLQFAWIWRKRPWWCSKPITICPNSPLWAPSHVFPSCRA